jgi:N-acetylmuramoyl-L-alanine amidase
VGQSFKPDDSGDMVLRLQYALRAYGYGIEETGNYDEATRNVVAAFQRHFRPARVDGIADASTLLTLRALIETRPAPLT